MKTTTEHKSDVTEAQPRAGGGCAGGIGSALHVYLIDDSEYVGAWSEEDALRYYETSEHRNPDSDGPEIKIADHHRFHEDAYSPDGDGKCTMIAQAEEMTQNVRRPAFHIGVPTDLL
jgi:hypothetical protein